MQNASRASILSSFPADHLNCVTAVASSRPSEIMPVDYKLRNLRRVFGEASFLKLPEKEGASRASGKSRGSRGSRGPMGPVGVPPPPSVDLPGMEGLQQAPDDASAAEKSAVTRRKKVKPPGGVPRAFYSEQPPRAIRNKAVASQMYTIHLYEKQKMKIYYSALGDAQFRRYVQSAKASRFNTDAQLLRLLELRLDSVLYRTGFVKTPMQARQWIFHGQVWMNGRRTDIKSCRVEPGDLIELRPGFEERAFIAQREAAETRAKFGVGASWIVNRSDVAGMTPWLEVDRIGLAAVLVREPTDEEVRSLKRAALMPYIRDANLDPHAAMRAYR